MSDSDRSIPPLDQHLKTINENGRAERTRMDKVIDFLLGKVVDQSVMVGKYEHINWEEDDGGFLFVLVLEATAHRPHLRNRQKLLELIEAAVSLDETKEGV